MAPGGGWAGSTSGYPDDIATRRSCGRSFKTVLRGPHDERRLGREAQLFRACFQLFRKSAKVRYRRIFPIPVRAAERPFSETQTGRSLLATGAALLTYALTSHRRVSSDCPWRDDPRGTGCGAQFSDLPPRRPPDMPVARRLRVVAGGKR